jgi:hypothetical protein
VYHEANPSFGEDARPLFEEGLNRSFALGVFDGLGGSGGARYVVDGVERKGAYIASRLARDVTAKTLMEAPESPLLSRLRKDGTAVPFSSVLGEQLKREFSHRATGLGGEPSKLRSTLVRVLPTTAAIAIVESPTQDNASGQRSATAIWAGDSRVYVLTPRDGLAQVSRDDVRVDTDALTSLSADPPIDNCINASEDFTLRETSWQLDGPCVVLAASDGCFGYLPTPAHFELELLQGLTEFPTPRECERRLNERFASLARDDATLAAAILDGGNFAQLQIALLERRSTVEAEFVAPYKVRHEHVVAAEEAAALAARRRDVQIEAQDKCARDLWGRYRRSYERYLAPPVALKVDK